MIQVLQEHIDRGVKLDCIECPVGLALKDAGYSSIEVEYTTLLVDGILYDTPLKVCAFAVDFDANKPVGPFSFDLPEPKCENN